MNTIKNIIFDLGGVLLDIDTTKTNAAFEQLGVTDFKNNYTLHKADALFDNLEKGIITEQAFYDGIRSISRLPLHNADIRDAWNALLLDFRTESLQYLEQLAATHRLYLLSNTNSIHHTAFHNNFTATTGRPNFDAYFTKAYYSQHIGLRKPDAARAAAAVPNGSRSACGCDCVRIGSHSGCRVGRNPSTRHRDGCRCECRLTE